MHGYLLQLQRAVIYLLNAEPGSAVSVEVLGDVAVKAGENALITEEDKSSLSSNPVTDRSTNLWKTFSNWIEAILKGKLNLEKTRFILYINHAGTPGLVDKLSESASTDQISSCLQASEQLLLELSEQHPTYIYLRKILDHKNLYEEIISRFELVIGSKSGSDEILAKLDQLIIPPNSAGFIHDELLGWTTNAVMQAVSQKLPAIISYEDFRKRLAHTLERARTRELIDFTKEYLSNDDEVKTEINTYPTYLQQILLIQLGEEDQVKAVSDFLRSKVNIEKWIEDDLIDERSAVELEEALKRFWTGTKKQVSITNKLISPEERGQLVYFSCMERNHAIAGRYPPSCTIPGVYHDLANQNLLGWHEDWLTKLKKEQ
tara:strand:+ start:64716 stop:65840 length:1125 start_codon:yes stop_codon:yes gene_type:complete